MEVVTNPDLSQYSTQLLGVISQEGVAAFHKVILSQATVFVGTDRSSFTADIERMRIGLGTASCHDSLCCEGIKFTKHSLDPWIYQLL